ncbi:MAG TPA: hypothetical protein VK148_15420 [Xanthobacteraceae bacterium]|nr:hypothetical protein [Xanthobacteraceae bacterium]
MKHFQEHPIRIRVNGGIKKWRSGPRLRFRPLLFLVKIVLHVWSEVDRRKEDAVADNEKAGDYNHDDQLLINC